VVVPAEGAALDEATLQGFLKEHIAGFKVPARIWLSDTPLPRLGTEKIDKVGLRNQYREVWSAEQR
jgi:acyl-CoA synthetase (AMP-forming)/AMP-acid ligase II